MEIILTHFYDKHLILESSVLFVLMYGFGLASILYLLYPLINDRNIECLGFTKSSQYHCQKSHCPSELACG